MKRKIMCWCIKIKGDDLSKFKVLWILILDKIAISPTLKKMENND